MAQKRETEIMNSPFSEALGWKKGENLTKAGRAVAESDAERMRKRVMGAYNIGDHVKITKKSAEVGPSIVGKTGNITAYLTSGAGKRVSVKLDDGTGRSFHLPISTIRHNPAGPVETPPNMRKQMGKVISIEADELYLYAWNTGELYPKRQEIEKKLRAFWNQNRYEKAKAITLWKHFADEAAKRYAKEFASPKEWNLVFSAKDRLQAAEVMEELFQGALWTDTPIKGTSAKSKGGENFVAIGRRAFREEFAAGAHFNTEGEARKHAFHVLEEHKDFSADEKKKFVTGFVAEWFMYHASGKNPGHSNALLYVGAALVMVGGLALAFMPKKAAAKSDTATAGAAVSQATTPEPAPKDSGITPAPAPTEPAKIAATFVTAYISGSNAILQGATAGFSLSINNNGTVAETVAIALEISGPVKQTFTVITGLTVKPYDAIGRAVSFSTSDLPVGSYDVRALVVKAGEVVGKSASVGKLAITKPAANFGGYLDEFPSSSKLSTMFSAKYHFAPSASATYSLVIRITQTGQPAMNFRVRTGAFASNVWFSDYAKIYFPAWFVPGTRAAIELIVEDGAGAQIWKSDLKFISVL